MKNFITKHWKKLFAFAGFIYTIVAYYPGFISEDGIYQYTQAIKNQYTDDHPPIMAFLWRGFYLLWPGRQTMLIFQLSMFWTSFYLLLSSSKRKHIVWAAILLVFSIAPFIQSFAGFIVKDSQMSFSLLLVFSILFRAFVQKRRLRKWEIIASIIFLFYGSVVRLNAPPASVPLISLLLFLVGVKTFKRQLLFTTLSFAAIILSNEGLKKFIIKPATHSFEVKLYMHDLAGIYAKTGKSYFPVFKDETFDTVFIRQHYIPATFDHIYYVAKEQNKKVHPELTEEKIREIKNAWETAIIQHPFAYLEHRWNGFLYFLKIKDRAGVVYYTFYPWPYVAPNDLGFTFGPNFFTKTILRVFETQQNMFYMRPWFWLLLNLVLFFYALFSFIKHRSKTILLVLTSSSILYIVPQFFLVSVDNTFRYFYWSCIAISLGLIITIAESLDVFKMKNKY